MAAPGANSVIRGVVLRASVLPLLLMTALAAVLGASIVHLQRLEAWVDHTDVVIAQMNRIERLTVDLETGLRGYLLTADPQFLAPTRAAQRDLGPALHEVEALVADNPGQVARVRALRDVYRDWNDYGPPQIYGGPDGPPRPLAHGKAIIDGARAIAGDFVSVEEALRRDRISKARRAADLVLGSAIAATVAFGAALAVFASRQIRRATGVLSRALRQSESARAALSESEERFRLFVEGARGQAIYLLDPAGRVQTWNVGAERITGYGPDQVVGRSYELFYPEVDRARGEPRRELDATAARGHVSVEAWRIRRDGTPFRAAVEMTALRSADGTLRGFAKVIADVTEARRSEERRRAQYEIVRILSESATLEAAVPHLLETIGTRLGWDLALLWRPDGEVLRITGAWARPETVAAPFLEETRGLVFRPGEGRPGRAWVSGELDWAADLASAPAFRRKDSALRHGLRSAVVWPVDGNRGRLGILEVFAAELRPADEDVLRLLRAIAQQVGGFLERVEAEAALRAGERQRAEELEATVQERTRELAELNRELEAFSYSVSHDLRAPLRSIEGFSELLREDYADRLDEPGRDYFRRIQAATRRMGQLIDDMLLLSRLTRAEVNREPVDVSEVAREVTDELRHREPARPVEVEVAPHLRARADPRLVRIALENLLANAWKFTRGREPARIEFGARQENGVPAYYVRDNGAGFDMAYVDKLFKPFQRLHRVTEYEGTGIGLATIQRIVHKHGGQAWAEGRPGEGATFYFTLEAAHG